jgi:hypothetical protein
MKARGVAIVCRPTPCRPEDDAEIAVVVLDVRVAVEREGVLSKPESGLEHAIVERLGAREGRDGEIDVVDPDDFSDSHGATTIPHFRGIR